jgi:hypothetical protein
VCPYRNVSLMGPASFPPGLPILGQADAAADSHPALFPSYTLCSHGQLSAVHQGRSEIRCQRRY